jgi:predicted amidohydrolase YtcJ
MPSPVADIVINGPIYRGDAVRGWSESIAIRGDRIVALGSQNEVKDHIGPNTRVIDARGKMITAGFQDAHIHAPFAGLNRLHVLLNDLPDREAYLATIKSYADANPDAEWIIGGGWALDHFPGGLPTKEDLDSIVPNRPVFLFNRDVHGAWVNSKALEIAGITKDTPDPWDGRIERNDAGDPSGMLHEGAAYTFNEKVVPLPNRATWEAAILNAQKHLHSLGITGWQDAWVIEGTLEAYKSLAESGDLTARVVGALWWDRHGGLEQIDKFKTQRETGRAGNFHPTTVKIMTDGVLENYTGALMQPFCDGCGGHTDNYGLSYVDHDELAAAVTALTGESFQVHMHVIGDRAVRNALDAVEAAITVHGRHDLRHHLAHIQLVQPEDIPRFRELDVVANCQAYWANFDPQMNVLTVPFLGQDRVDLSYPFNSLLKNGTVLAMGSDWSVSTANPLAQMEVAVTRIGPLYRDQPAFLAHEAIPIEAALNGFTNGTAYVNHDEQDAGSLAVGKRADLVILDQDLFKAEHLSDARVELTMASGKVVYDITS